MKFNALTVKFVHLCWLNAGSKENKFSAVNTRTHQSIYISNIYLYIYIYRSFDIASLFIPDLRIYTFHLIGSSLLVVSRSYFFFNPISDSPVFVPILFVWRITFDWYWNIHAALSAGDTKLAIITFSYFVANSIVCYTKPINLDLYFTYNLQKVMCTTTRCQLSAFF